MNQATVENRIKTAMEAAAPDIFDLVMQQLDSIPLNEKSVSTELKKADDKENKENKENKVNKPNKQNIFIMPARFITLRRSIISAAAMIVLIVGLVFGMRAYNTHVVSVINIDVNPSIEIRLNARERVVDISAINTDADAIISGLDVAGKTLDTTVDIVLERLLGAGYIDEGANSIMVTVINSDKQRGAKIKTKLVGEIETMLVNHDVQGAVISQVIENDETINKLAKENHISPGRAKLIKTIAENDETVEFSRLAQLPVNDLALIAKDDNNVIKEIEVKGDSSEKKYIGTAMCRKTVYAAAGVTGTQNERISMKLGANGMVYIMQFNAGGYDYLYTVNALNGDIISKDFVVHGKGGEAGNKNEDEYEKGKNVFDDVHRAEKDERTVVSSVPEKEGNGYKYGKTNEEKTTQTSSAAVSSTVTSSSGVSKNTPSSVSSAVSSAATYISEATAKSTAFTDAGANAANVTELSVEFEKDDTHYDIEFVYAGKRYEYKINAVSGVIISAESITIEQGGGREEPNERDEPDEPCGPENPYERDEPYGPECPEEGQQGGWRGGRNAESPSDKGE